MGEDAVSWINIIWQLPNVQNSNMRKSDGTKVENRGQTLQYERHILLVGENASIYMKNQYTKGFKRPVIYWGLTVIINSINNHTVNGKQWGFNTHSNKKHARGFCYCWAIYEREQGNSDIETGKGAWAKAHDDPDKSRDEQGNNYHSQDRQSGISSRSSPPFFMLFFFFTSVLSYGALLFGPFYYHLFIYSFYAFICFFLLPLSCLLCEQNFIMINFTLHIFSYDIRRLMTLLSLPSQWPWDKYL